MPHQSLVEYIAAAREKGHSDNQIKADLLAAGWDRKMVAAGLKGQDDDLPVPPPPSAQNHDPQVLPHAVVQNFSTRGLEYIIMFIALAVAATSLGSILHSSVNTLFGSDGSLLDSTGPTSIASSALIVSFPILAYLFLRLKKAELSDDRLRRDPSRKKSIQLTLIVTFIVGLGNVINFVYSLISSPTSTAPSYNAFGSPASSSILGNFVHLAITLAIAGGIFLYYWRDEHQDA